jgi:hypothetical protein
LVTDHGGYPGVRFADDRLYLATATSERSSATELRSVALFPTPTILGSVVLRGNITTLAPRPSGLLALGSLRSASGSVRLIVHDVDVRGPGAPRIRGTVSFGDDRTASPAESAEAAIGFATDGRQAVVPFTSFADAERRYVAGAQLVELTGSVPILGPTLPVKGYAERMLILDGHVLAIGSLGVHAVDDLGEGRGLRDVF